MPVGGFLGAGKTRLIIAATQILSKSGIRTAAILNDQGEDLVDTEWVTHQGMAAQEVSGACFCCQFSKLLRSIEQLRSADPAVIFLEPVGSCTDISATVLQPLKSYHKEFQLAPFTVLIDPARARSLSKPSADQQLEYLFTQQLLEADLIVWSKSDIHRPGLQSSGFRNLRQLSAKSGEGVGAWLSEVIGGKIEPGSKLLEDIDYRRYAAAEACLGWLNWQVSVRLSAPLSAAMLGGPLFDSLQATLIGAGVSIVHLKMIVRSASGFIEVAVCANEDEPEVDGDLTASPASEHEIIVNLRAKANPEQLSLLALAAFEQLPGVVRYTRRDCFQPAAPEPEVRLTEVVRPA